MDQFGLQKKNYFCIAIRDGEYHSKKNGQEGESYRNLDFTYFLPMIEGSCKYTTKIVRLGRLSKESYFHKNLFDYSSSEYSCDLADVVILKNSLGLINSADGIGSVAEVLDIPTLFISHAPWEILNTFSSNNWIVPALFTDLKSNQLAKAHQVFNYQNISMSVSDFNSRNLKIIHPNADEIKSYCYEFMDAINKMSHGKMAEMSLNLDTIELRQFWRNYYNSLPYYAKPYHKSIKAYVPRLFLKKYSKKLFIRNY